MALRAPHPTGTKVDARVGTFVPSSPDSTVCTWRGRCARGIMLRMKTLSRAVLTSVIAAGLLAGAPVAKAEAATVVTPYAGAIGNTFECDGALGRLWCKK